MDSPQASSSQAKDIFSLSDQVLAERLQFIEEIGFGNWGSVWLCRPKSDPASNSSPTKYKHVKIAVKLVHRSKTQTTAARVRSLWNEMKVVRSLKNEQHPSIVPFYSFIITPSYALITMAFLPRLVPVEVDEPLAKQWFQSLLSGVEFLHSRGVVHNDIKPANILLSEEEVPVLVDFGFAEKYELDSSKAFKSNLAYGTPEYLSPERARGLHHDTRKSDVWSLGITFFEILVGRTPFEYVEGEQFSTKEDLEKYWARTLRGKWVGSWKMSKAVEKMLRRMISPNAELRCTSSEAMDDSYWHGKEVDRSAHRKSANLAQGAFSAMDTSKLLDIVSPFTTRTANTKREAPNKSHNKENVVSPPSRNTPIKIMKAESASAIASRSKRVPSKSQPQTPNPTAQSTADTPSKSQPLKPLTFAPMAPIKGSSSSSIVVIPTILDVKASSPNGKENPPSTPKPKLVTVTSESRSRKPAGPRKAPLSPERPKNMSSIKGNRENENPVSVKSSKKENSGSGKQRGVLMDRSVNSNVMTPTRSVEIDRNAVNTVNIGKGSVKNRWMDWERERERLREMDRLQEKIKEAEEETEKERVGLQEEEARAREEQEREAALEAEREKEREAQRQLELEEQRKKLEEELRDIQTRSRENIPTQHENDVGAGDVQLESGLQDGLPRPNKRGSGLSVLKTSLVTTFERGVQMCKTSNSLAYIGKQSNKLFSHSADPRKETMVQQDNSVALEADSSVPVITQAARRESSEHQSQEDRMKLWIKNVNKVVEDARKGLTPAPVPATLEPRHSLPIAPVSRYSSQKKAPRATRKILAASEIFAANGEASTSSIGRASRAASILKDRPLSTFSTNGIRKSPAGSPVRRATVNTLSPERKTKRNVEGDSIGTSSSWKEKSKSQSHLLLNQPITNLSKLEMEVEQSPESEPSPPLRLSAVVDASLFIASPSGGKRSTMEVNDLTRSPCRVEPYPAKSYAGRCSLDSPNTKRRMESKHDQLVTSTSNVRKAGMGYQSESREAISNIAEADLIASTSSKRNLAFFNSTRRAMPGTVANGNWRRTVSVDELRNMETPTKLDRVSKEDRVGTSSVVRRAFNIMTGKTHSRRLSRIL